MRISGIDLYRYAEAWPADFRTVRYDDPVNEAKRRQVRIRRLGREILPAIGAIASGAPLAAARAWLEKRGYGGPWTGELPSFDLCSLRDWYAGAFMIGHHLRERPWTCIGCTASNLGDGRFVYWDVVDGGRKYALRGAMR